MGMLDRIKRQQFVGFKEFVQSMEITGAQKRQQIFIAGVLEDPIFMNYVMKNIKTFQDFLTLPSDELDVVLTTQDQIMSIFAKSMFGKAPEELKELESTIPHLYSKFKDELSYLKDLTPSEIDGAKFYMVKTARKLQMEDRILGFKWQLPPQDLFYQKAHKDGLNQVFFESGVLAAEGEYSKGKRVGRWTHNYDTGKMLAEGDYDGSGLKTGIWTFYYGQGALKSQGKYRSDLKTGMWKEWDRAGVLTEVEYKEGVKV